MVIFVTLPMQLTLDFSDLYMCFDYAAELIDLRDSSPTLRNTWVKVKEVRHSRGNMPPCQGKLGKFGDNYASCFVLQF